MRIRRVLGLRHVLTGFLAVASGGCALVLGLDEFVDQPAGTGGAGGEGGAGACTPGEERACYDGPAGTEGQGMCVAGTQTCEADGLGWGSCEGQVLPGVEDCKVPGDEDCDGNPCSDALWSHVYGGTGYERATDVAVDTEGNVIVVGYFNSTITFGETTLITSGSRDYFLAKLDKDGNALWVKQFGSAGDNGDLISVTVGSQGEVFIAGALAGSADFGAGLTTSAGANDIFAAAFDASGSLLWGKLWGDAAYQGALDIAAGTQDNVVVVGSLAGTTDFDGTSYIVPGLSDGFVASFDTSDGAHKWSKRVGDIPGQGTASQSVHGVVLDTSGNVVIHGQFTTSIDFGGATLTDLSPSFMPYIAKLDSGGNYVWANKYADFSFRSLSVDSSGDVIVGGSVDGTASFGGPDLAPSGRDIFLGKLRFDGEYVWGKNFGGPLGDAGSAVVGPGDTIFLAGEAKQSVDFGGGALQGSGDNEDIIFAKLTSAGDHIWSKMLSAEQYQGATSLHVDPVSGAVVAVGGAAGIIDFGNGPLITSGMSDAFVVKLAP